MPVTDYSASARLETHTLWYDGRDGVGARDVPVETPVNIIYETSTGTAPFAVMMCTPQDLEDFAYGFSLTEGVVGCANDVERVAIHPQERGLELTVTLAAGITPQDRERNTAGRTGCGLCGIDQLDALPLARVSALPRVTVELSAIKRALDALEHGQVINRVTHAVHAAAWCKANGDIVSIREDVGRHNALDKLLGALIRAGHKADDGFLVITSRCSFEMVEKAAVFGARTIVAISAPTSLAIERAMLHGITLLAVARRDSTLVFHGLDMVRNDSAAPVTPAMIDGSADANADAAIDAIAEVGHS